MSSCNVPNQNVHIVNSISHHTKPLSVGKSDCLCNVSKSVIKQIVYKIINICQVFNPVQESAVVNHSKCACKPPFNASSHKHGIMKSLNVKNILMTSVYFYELVLSFFIFHHNSCNGNVDNFLKRYIKHKNFSWNNFFNYGSFIDHDVYSVNIFNISHTNV